jgi:hypothetical protein
MARVFRAVASDLLTENHVGASGVLEDLISLVDLGGLEPPID